MEIRGPKRRQDRPRIDDAGRRGFLAHAGAVMLGGLAACVPGVSTAATRAGDIVRRKTVRTARLFLGGDVMTGRGIDQIQRRPGDPVLYERSAKSALTYVALAEKASGPIPRNVAPDYIWGDALVELDRVRPDARIVNLETAVTTARDAWPNKRVHYRMHPANIGCLSAAQLDCCTLANNHVLDWSYVGLRETLATLKAAGLRTAGAGDTLAQARAPAIIDLSSGGRVVVLAYGSTSSGVPREWQASQFMGGVNGISEDDSTAASRVAEAVRKFKRPGDLAVAAIHWGGNWGYDVPDAQRRLAHALIDEAGIDVVCGHSSHHPRPIEVHSGKLVLYGCGDLLNDYEGIGGHEAFRPELGFLYLPEIDLTTGRLQRMVLRPTRVHKFRITFASDADAAWLRDAMQREGRPFGTRFTTGARGDLELAWG